MEYSDAYFMCNIIISDKSIMPINIVIDDEELEWLEEFGGLEAETVKTRETNYMWFVKYVESEGFEFVELFASEDGREKFCDVFSRFFFSLRVNCRDDGTNLGQANLGQAEFRPSEFRPSRI